MAELANCPNCNAVFVKTVRDICQACFQEEEKAFEIVYHYLSRQRNREATLDEIVEATGVKEKLIIKFIKAQRLRTSQFPNLGYSCEKCGTKITQGKLCEDCSTGFLQELQKEAKTEKRQEELRKRAAEEERKKSRIYFSIDKDRK